MRASRLEHLPSGGSRSSGKAKEPEGTNVKRPHSWGGTPVHPAPQCFLRCFLCLVSGCTWAQNGQKEEGGNCAVFHTCGGKGVSTE